MPPEPHESRGIGKPYPKEYRKQMMIIHDNSPQVLESPAAIAAQRAHVHAANITNNRWLQQRDLLGHVRTFQRTEN